MPVVQRAAELKEEESRRPGNAEFEQGKFLYGRGQYRDAEAVLLKAVELAGSYSKLGGEIQLWLALAYQVCIVPARLASMAINASKLLLDRALRHEQTLCRLSGKPENGPVH